jgi:hypothetical protein
MHISNRRVPWKTANVADNPVLQELQFQQMGFFCKFPGGTGISHWRLNESFVEGQINISA